jgi:hypothetical protein
MNGCSCGRAREAFEVGGAASRRARGGPRSARAPARTAASRRGISGKGQGTSATCRGSSSAAKWAGSDVPAARSAGVSLSRAPLDPNHARKPANRSSDRPDLHQTRFLHAHGSAHMARQEGGGGRRAGRAPVPAMRERGAGHERAHARPAGRSRQGLRAELPRHGLVRFRRRSIVVAKGKRRVEAPIALFVCRGGNDEIAEILSLRA